MTKNKNYKFNKTVQKGFDQIINILSSAAFSTMVIMICRLLCGKDINIKYITEVIESLSQMGVLLIPVISALIAVINNIRKHYYKKL